MKNKKKSIEERICCLFDRAKERFLKQNEKHGGIFFQLSLDNSYRNLWKKWIVVQELFDNKLEFTEDRKKDFIDFAIYLLMTCEYLSSGSDFVAAGRKIRAFIFDSNNGKFVEYDLDKKPIPAKKLFSYQNFDLMQMKETGELIFVEFIDEEKEKHENKNFAD